MKRFSKGGPFGVVSSASERRSDRTRRQRWIYSSKSKLVGNSSSTRLLDVTKLDPSKMKKRKKKKTFIRQDATYESEPDYGYAELLSRVFDMLHEEVSTERPRTVMMRHPQLLAQGTQITICLDFAHLCTTMHRKPGHVIKFLLGQMETKGWLNKQHQLEMKGFVSSQHFQAVFQRYIAAAKVQTQLSRRTMVFPLSAVRCVVW
ncbi:eukaryotic translation initiation factor 2 subunit beta isoform X2 [Raphanus sativus]|uniref:Eukaryotic translation initiation factor 2 subunit beta isoform X2 n=1 Tax=Raphanus sativus TaxID=3726 RepID=A0A9W3DCQ3_RAPSA|nr:eukaryotic translation initiation factor 2 subunit beta isoform X2 [Raphanus sativus]